MKSRITLSSSGARSGFTLLEIVLAIAIAIGLLMVLLHFYQQTSKLRSDILEQTEKITAIRLFIDRLSQELRSAHRDEFLIMGLTGGSNFLEVVTATLPRIGLGDENPDTWGPQTDLNVVRYIGSDIAGPLERSSEPLLESLLPPGLADEVAPVTEKTRAVTTPIDAIHFVRFRYWDGLEWLDEWFDWALPIGVEISVGQEPLPEDGDPAEYPYELFQRVVYLPEAGVTTSLDRFADTTEDRAP